MDMPSHSNIMLRAAGAYAVVCKMQRLLASLSSVGMGKKERGKGEEKSMKVVVVNTFKRIKTK